VCVFVLSALCRERDGRGIAYQLLTCVLSHPHHVNCRSRRGRNAVIVGDVQFPVLDGYGDAGLSVMELPCRGLLTVPAFANATWGPEITVSAYVPLTELLALLFSSLSSMFFQVRRLSLFRPRQLLPTHGVRELPNDPGQRICGPC
jgi:hypothetical protein